MVRALNQLNLTNKGENMNVKDYATQMVEKQLDVVKELLINNEITEAQAAEKIEQIDNIELVTNMDPSDIAYEMVMESRS
jgi:hypothetical protein